MSFSYVLATPVGKVRLLIGDVTDDCHLIEDEEIEFFLEEEPNIYYAGAAAAEAIARKLQAGYFDDEKVGETRLRTKRINELILLSNQLRNRGSNHKLPSAGGVFKSDRDNLLGNPDILQGDFSRGIHDFPGTTRRSRPPSEFEG